MIHSLSRAEAGAPAMLVSSLLAASAALGQSAGPPAVAAATTVAATPAASQPPAGQGKAQPAARARQTTVAPKSAGPPSHYLPNRFAGRAGLYYKYVWGIDSLSVKLMESGELIRFTWRVVDANRAEMLNDKKAAPSLIDPHAGVSLVVPSMEKVGQLRQSGAPEIGKSYWLAFSNKGRTVRRGDRVNVVIGSFRAEGLAVD